MRKQALALAAFALAIAFPGAAHALLCTPILGCTCTVSALPIDFGAFSPLGAAQQQAQGEIDVDCTGVIDVAPSLQVQLQSGQWGTISARRMRSGAGELMSYNLYTTAQHNVVWGDGGTGSAVTVSGGLVTLGAWSVQRNIYALASPNANQNPGAYSDIVVVRIEW